MILEALWRFIGGAGEGRCGREGPDYVLGVGRLL